MRVLYKCFHSAIDLSIKARKSRDVRDAHMAALIGKGEGASPCVCERICVCERVCVCICVFPFYLLTCSLRLVIIAVSIKVESYSFSDLFLLRLFYLSGSQHEISQ